MLNKPAVKSPLNLLNELKPTELKTAAARRFVEFCLQDFPTYSKANGFDSTIYLDAAKLVIDRLEAARYRED